MKSGCFKLLVKPKRISGTSKMDYDVTGEHNSEVLLQYEPTMESLLKKRRLKALSENYDEAPVLKSSTLERQFSCVSETWNSEQIDDFVRKLGFLEAQNADVEHKVKLFQQLNQVIHWTGYSYA